MLAWVSGDVLSRRGLLRSGAASALLPFAANAQDTNKKSSRPALTVPVMLNGRGPFHFAVDTTAERTFISEKIAAVLGLPAGKDLNVQGAVSTVHARLVKIDDLSPGPDSHLALEVPVLASVGQDCDGELGIDFLLRHRVSFDFKHNTVAIEPAGTRLPKGPSVALLIAHREYAMLWLDCRIDDLPCRAIIATGAEVSVGNPALLDALKIADPSHDRPSLGTLPLTGVTGGTTQADIIRVDLVKAGSVRFSDAVLAIADLEIFKTWGLTVRPALLIGMNFLRQFDKMIIDYGTNAFYFCLPGADGTEAAGPTD
jgi:predicted aspartyl protease